MNAPAVKSRTSRRGARALSPAPPGFTLTARFHRAYRDAGDALSPELMAWVKRDLADISLATGQTFGDPDHPLLIALHRGPTGIVLNLGLNDKSIPSLTRLTDERFAFDCYRSLIHTFGSLVAGIPGREFERALAEMKRTRGIVHDIELTDDDWEECVRRYKNVYRQRAGEPFPQDPDAQLCRAVEAALKRMEKKFDMPRRRR